MMLRGPHQHLHIYRYSTGERNTFTSKYTSVSENVVHAIKCRTCHKMIYFGEAGRRLGDRFREPLRSTGLSECKNFVR